MRERYWELLILDGRRADPTSVGDVDGDGKMEIVGATRRDPDGNEHYESYRYKPTRNLPQP